MKVKKEEEEEKFKLEELTLTWQLLLLPTAEGVSEVGLFCNLRGAKATGRLRDGVDPTRTIRGAECEREEVRACLRGDSVSIQGALMLMFLKSSRVGRDGVGVVVGST